MTFLVGLLIDWPARLAALEFIGGLLLLLGLFTRLAAVPLIIVMVVAVLTAKWPEVDSLETLLGFD